ncbi:hypothetical protein QJS04_geneDACA022212 [Acorus gramineus]|uniref:DUF8040 domain-containing protein n=1 Tax=Acorus gramineus TaxID=55184 RepID=A0AAV9BAN2_ACOGR|nr:hypothetical protein QJS04_geneDACA022212 [Acorus gramineus]
MMAYYYKMYVAKERVHDSIHGGESFVRDCLEGHRRNSFDLLRMEPEMYQLLCNTLREKDFLRNTRNISVEEQVAIFLNTVGHNERNRATQHTFQHSGETISRHFNAVLNAICKLGLEYITMPSTDTPLYIRSQSRFFPYFKVKLFSPFLSLFVLQYSEQCIVGWEQF